MDMKLEVLVIPVSDVDRAKQFYAKLGWRLDADFATGSDFRVIQFTPRGSSCSVIFGKNVTAATPGSAQGLYLIVSDIVTAGEASKSARCSMTRATCTLERTSPICSGCDGLAVRTPSIAATARSPHSAIRMATAGCSRRSRRGFPVGSTPQQQRSVRRAIWRACFGARRPLTASTRNVPARETPTGPIGTRSTWLPSRPAQSCRNERRS